MNRICNSYRSLNKMLWSNADIQTSHMIRIPSDILYIDRLISSDSNKSLARIFDKFWINYKFYSGIFCRANIDFRYSGSRTGHNVYKSRNSCIRCNWLHKVCIKIDLNSIYLRI